MPSNSRLSSLAPLLLLTLAALLVHGYHVGVEDQAVYLPAVKQDLDPALYPHDAQFFLILTRATLFDEAVAFTVRASHLPLEAVLLLWYAASVLLVLWGCLRLARRFFPGDGEAQWCGVALVAALLTLPVTGTALYLVDPYLHPRAPATAALLFMLADVLERKPLRAGVFLLVAASLHIQMAFYGAALAAFLWIRPEDLRRFLPGRAAAAMWLLPFSSLFQPGSDAWLEAARTRRFHYLARWEWYEWLGIFAPLAMLWWFASLGKRNGLPLLTFFSRRLAAFGGFIFIAAAALTMPPKLERFTPYQPMRGFHLLYLLFVLLAGGLLGRFVLQRKLWRWALLFAPLCSVMFVAQRQIYPASPHLELPGVAPKNQWLQAFAWIKQNTPQDAYFALNPQYVRLQGEDAHGFRAFAERSMMADYVKDSGVALLFPALAEPWRRQVRARDHWADFKREDFERLQRDFGVTWVVLESSHSAAATLHCPYGNSTVQVCRID